MLVKAIRLLVALFAAAVICMSAALTPHAAVHAQTFPSTCRPVGTKDCASKLAGPWIYLPVNCNVGGSRQKSEDAALQVTVSADWSSYCTVTYDRVGWFSVVTDMLANGWSRDCPGSDIYTPVFSSGVQTSNYSRYTPWTYTFSQPGCSSSQTANLLPVRRDRGVSCPRGYASGGSYCTVSQLDTFRNVGCCADRDAVFGNPVNTAIGNKIQEEVDYRGGGPFPIVFTRFYNSQLTRPDLNADTYFNFNTWKTYFGSNSFHEIAAWEANESAAYPDVTESRFRRRGVDIIGANWRHSYQRSIEVVGVDPNAPAPGDVVTTAFVYRPDGKVLPFVAYNGSFVGSRDSKATLTQLGDGSWRFLNEDNETEQYDASGRLESITNVSGLVQHLTYDSADRVVSVSDDFGHTLVIEYAADSNSTIGAVRISRITDPAGNSVLYGYGNDNTLTSVTFPGAVVRTYVYGESAFGRALTGIVDEDNVRYVTWTYDSTGRAAGMQYAGGAGSYSMVYTPVGLYGPQEWISYVDVTDPLGAVRRVTFSTVDGVNRVSSVRQPAPSGSGTVTSTRTFDSNGNVTKRTDFKGGVTCFQYDLTRNLEIARVEGFASGSSCPANLSTYAPSAGTRQRKILTTWDAVYRLPATITESNRTTSFTYNAAGNLLTKTITDTSVTPNVARTWTYTYDAYGRVLMADGPRTDVTDTTTYTYYGCSTGYQCGQLNTVTNALGQLTTYSTYNAHGQPLTIIDPNGMVTTLAYDARQRLTSRQTGSETTSFQYYPTGLLQRVTLPDGSYAQYTYDTAHRLTDITDAAGNHIHYTLDAMGNRTSESAYDPTSVLSRTRTRVYNTLNLLYQEIGSAGTAAVTTSFAYDANGNQTNVNAPLTRNTVNAFDELNRLKQITDPAAGNTYFAYDANDNLVSVQDPRSLSTTYAYTGFGDLKTQASPDTGTTTNTYDSGGNIATTTDARSAVTTYAYDALNRVASAAYSLGGTTDQTITYSYDAGTNGKGRLTGASDSAHSLSWTYDPQGRALTKSQTVGTLTKSVTYAYTSGQLTTLTTPSGQSLAFGYSNNQVTSISVNGTTLLSNVQYEPFGPARSWTWGNATSEIRLHDTDGNTSQVSGVETMTFGFDSAFRITSATHATNSALSWTYGYDGLDRLTSALQINNTLGWTYDANGNRLTQTGTVAATYTIATTSNRLNSIAGTPARTYGYDSAGNVLTYGTVTYTFNNRGRMKTAQVGGSTTTYVYNALGQRVQKSSGAAGTVLFVYDEAGHLLGEYDGTGALIEETVWLGDVPVATLRPNGPSVAIYYVHADQLGAPRTVSRPSDNAIAWRWDADPFGTPLPNENPAGLGTFKYNLRFPGQYYDLETGTSYNYFRDYDPQIGRYVESDPIGLKAGINTYAYTESSPVDLADPTGLLSCTYHNATGRLFCYNNAGSELLLTGGLAAAGQGMCQDKSYCEMIKNEGPLPRGDYRIKPPGYVSKHPKWLFLKPSNRNYMYSRGEFFIHPWGISNGCISIYFNNDFKTLSDWAATDNGGDLSVVP